MTGVFTIGGINAYTEWGVYVIQGGYLSLAAYPKLKDIDVNDWSDKDGEEVDLSDPKLGKQDIELKLAISNKNNFSSFMENLMSSVFHTLFFNDIGITRTLRYLSMSVDNIEGDLMKFSVRFSDDFPLYGYSYVAPTKYGEDTGFLLDSVDLSNYGITVLSGSSSNVFEFQAAKEALEVNVSNKDGVIYDSGATVRLKARDITLPLLMKAENITKFWVSHQGFLYNLKKAGERRLTCLGFDYRCYYKSMNPSLFSPEGIPWLKFSLVLRIIGLYV